MASIQTVQSLFYTVGFSQILGHLIQVLRGNLSCWWFVCYLVWLGTVKAVEYVIEVSALSGMSSVDEIVRFIETRALPPTVRATEWAFMVKTLHIRLGHSIVTNFTCRQLNAYSRNREKLASELSSILCKKNLSLIDSCGLQTHSRSPWFSLKLRVAHFFWIETREPSVCIRLEARRGVWDHPGVRLIKWESVSCVLLFKHLLHREKKNVRQGFEWEQFEVDASKFSILPFKRASGDLDSGLFSEEALEWDHLEQVFPYGGTVLSTEIYEQVHLPLNAYFLELLTLQFSWLQIHLRFGYDDLVSLTHLYGQGLKSHSTLQYSIQFDPRKSEDIEWILPPKFWQCWLIRYFEHLEKADRIGSQG